MRKQRSLQRLRAVIQGRKSQASDWLATSGEAKQVLDQAPGVISIVRQSGPFRRAAKLGKSIVKEVECYDDQADQGWKLGFLALLLCCNSLLELQLGCTVSG